MSRYRRVSPRFWKDERIVTLQPFEKLVALYLFTSPQTNRIGLFSFSPGEACEDLGVPIETFREGWAKPFANVSQTLNLGWDSAARVLYLPTWWKYNCPENPNVLKACLKDLDEVPQTSLIVEFSTNLRYLPETFHQTFHEGLPKPSPNLSPQEQEQERESAKRTRARQKKETSNPNIRAFFDWWAEKYSENTRKRYDFNGGKEGALIATKLRTFTLDELQELADRFFATDDQWIREHGGFTIGVFCSQINKLNSTGATVSTPRKELRA